MATTTTATCNCGHENSPEYQYCGGCGSSLRKASKVAEDTFQQVEVHMPESAIFKKPALAIDKIAIRKMDQEAMPQVPVDRAKLEQSQAADSEDLSKESAASQNELSKPRPTVPPSYWRMHVALGLLMITAGVLVHNWQQNGFPLAAFLHTSHQTQMQNISDSAPVASDSLNTSSSAMHSSSDASDSTNKQ